MADYTGPAGPDLKKIAEAENKKFLEQGAQESVEGLGQQYKRLQGIAGEGGFSSTPASSPLASRMAALAAQRQGDIEGSFQRELPMSFAARNAGFQGLADRNVQAANLQKKIEDMMAEQRAAKRRAFQRALGTTAGAVAGGLIGGPAGAQIGAGAAGMMYK